MRRGPNRSASRPMVGWARRRRWSGRALGDQPLPSAPRWRGSRRQRGTRAVEIIVELIGFSVEPRASGATKRKPNGAGRLGAAGGVATARVSDLKTPPAAGSGRWRRSASVARHDRAWPWRAGAIPPWRSGFGDFLVSTPTAVSANNTWRPSVGWGWRSTNPSSSIWASVPPMVWGLTDSARARSAVVIGPVPGFQTRHGSLPATRSAHVDWFSARSRRVSVPVTSPAIR